MDCGVNSVGIHCFFGAWLFGLRLVVDYCMFLWVGFGICVIWLVSD